VTLVPHSPAWYDRLATLQTGYHYPWQSTLGPFNGEDVFLAIVRQHLQPDADVLEVACGHGELALAVAPHVRSLLAYDRVPVLIELAHQAAQDQGSANVRFMVHDSSAEANGGSPRLPADDASFDLLLCRKGPFHCMEDARRVARPGAALLMLVPDNRPHPVWHDALPDTLRWPAGGDPGWARRSVEQRLEIGRLSVDSWWEFDVPELIPSPEQLYVLLTWGHALNEVPAFAEVRPILERIFAEHATLNGIALRHHRHVWKAVVPG
jgi:SAM-dependent methyltransferase